EQLIATYQPIITKHGAVDKGEPLWDESTIVLITYGDQIRDEGVPSLRSLRNFLVEHQLDRSINTVHLLPIFPYSSDDGFSVIDYRAIRKSLGDWQDVKHLGQKFDLALDFVLNHCSRESSWFAGYLNGEQPFVDFFIEVDPDIDLSDVTRPRTSPLLTSVQTNRGERHVWSTFSSDQMDLNFASPSLLMEMLDILLLYVANGAKIIRLDAIGFLWKEIGTTCMHLPQTHEVVKLMRTILDAIAPDTILLTETNVPHQENISYFGRGDEARAVYQFSLAPLLLDAYLRKDASLLQQWLEDLEYPETGMTFFNFTASHDGIGVRPLEGIVPPERIDALANRVLELGGKVNWRERPDGSQSPYELNITYFSALAETDDDSGELHVRKFLASQAIMLSLRGIPGVYFHSLIGSENDLEGVLQTGENRSINRQKFSSSQLRERLAGNNPKSRIVFEGYQKLLSLRCRQKAFHPEAAQKMLSISDSRLIAFERTSCDGEQKVIVLANFSNQQIVLPLPSAPSERFDLLSGDRIHGSTCTLNAYQVVWLV
ncbi:MAG: sugar phosphorylase, partial [Planctomycetota bacterium]|nr:sugar phosphorylase [Planctomycetota bacterium]